MTETDHSGLDGLENDHIQSTIAMQDYFARFNNYDSLQDGDISLIYGELHIAVDGKWFKCVNAPTPDHCLYCGSGWNESKYHPGTCGNCGAGALFAQEKTNVN